MKLLQFLRSSYKVGDSVKITRIITQKDLNNFSSLTNDHNPIHKENHQKPLVHGAFLNAIVAGIIGSKLPGDGSVVVSQSFSFPNKCYVGEPIDVNVELIELRKIIKVKYECTQNNQAVMSGEARLVMNKE